MQYETREAWLMAALELLRPIFGEAHRPLPEPGMVKVSCGFPCKGGVSEKPAKAINVGETWATECVEGGVFQVFVSPRLRHDLTVLSTLVHELCHVVDQCKHGHKVAFKKVANAVGLVGKATATTAGLELIEKLEHIANQLGQYPNPEIRPIFKEKKQTCRQRKAECPECGYTIRLAKAWADKGLPLCSKCMVAFELDLPLGEQPNDPHPEWN